ncbi:MAG: DUF971 domain-containing protein [Melioribacter sp.]|nr:DUF971 domain-containing protein [Melioribacter sp.]
MNFPICLKIKWKNLRVNWTNKTTNNFPMKHLKIYSRCKKCKACRTSKNFHKT